MTQLGQIKTVLEKRTGKQVIITKYTEQSLIGGMRVKIGNIIIDGSVNGRLERMKERLMARS
jgi:F-type H+-transporting ATPase subunit delta